MGSLKQRYRTIGCTVADLFHRLLQIVAFNESGGGCYFDFNGKMWTFEDGEGHWVILIIEPMSVEIGVDTEDASLVEEIRIGKNHGIYVEKGSEHSIVWGNPDTEQVFTMVSNGLEKIDMEKAAEKIC